MKKKIISLPRTPEEFDLLVKAVVKKYKIDTPDLACAVIATRIQHMPVDQSTTTLEYLGGCVIKSLAYNIATHKLQTLNHKYQVDAIMNALKVNPYDQEARDALIKASNEGSGYAKEKLAEFEENHPKADNLIPIHKAEDTATCAVPSEPAG